MIFKHIVDLVEVFVKKGGTTCVVAPGSRNAPLTIAFAQHPKIATKSVTDERSAGFIALGMAKKLKAPVVLICTSGSAALNFAPAVAEAYFQKVPLLILTADRPPEWIGQQDGQMIYQENLYGANCKRFFRFPVNPSLEDEFWYCNRVVNEAINLSLDAPKGPVHINIPFREPFYPEKGEKIEFTGNCRVVEEVSLNQIMRLRDWNKLGKSINRSNNILLIAGMLDVNWKFHKGIERIPFPVIADITSNLQTCSNAIIKHDSILLRENEDLKPDLIISFGDMILSKPLKKFLRTYKPKEHWHIQQSGEVADTFQTITRIIRTSPITFLSELADYDFSIHSADYLDFWRLEQADVNGRFKKLLNTNEFNEFVAVDSILKNIHEKTVLHLANSMSVRYAAILSTNKDIEIYSNRGTSGIDGCTSTAIGFALKDEVINVLLTGDVAFFYDRNAFWNHHVPAHFRVIILNNGGGGIFKIIEGPSIQAEVDDYFVTKQTSKAKYLAMEHGLEYSMVDGMEELDRELSTFFEPSDTAKILEIKTDIDKNTAFFNVYKKIMSNG